MFDSTKEDLLKVCKLLWFVMKLKGDRYSVNEDHNYDSEVSEAARDIQTIAPGVWKQVEEDNELLPLNIDALQHLMRNGNPQAKLFGLMHPALRIGARTATCVDDNNIQSDRKAEVNAHGKRDGHTHTQLLTQS